MYVRLRKIFGFCIDRSDVSLTLALIVFVILLFFIPFMTCLRNVVYDNFAFFICI